jgi:alkylhydroperoxidase family enzyme
LARRLGATEAEMLALEKGDLSVFGARERVALEFAEKLTRDSNHVPDALFAELRRHFDEGQIVEVAAVAGIFNYFNRFNNALQMEPTR